MLLHHILKFPNTTGIGNFCLPIDGVEHESRIAVLHGVEARIVFTRKYVPVRKRRGELTAQATAHLVDALMELVLRKLFLRLFESPAHHASGSVRGFRRRSNETHQLALGPSEADGARLEMLAAKADLSLSGLQRNTLRERVEDGLVAGRRRDDGDGRALKGCLYDLYRPPERIEGRGFLVLSGVIVLFHGSLLKVGVIDLPGTKVEVPGG